jgi:hypothetical protein
MDTKADPVSLIDLPPLPEPRFRLKVDTTIVGNGSHTTTSYEAGAPLLTTDQVTAYAAQAVREERERCAQAIEARLSALDSAQSQLGSDEYGARCCVEGRKQQVKADAAAIRSQPMPGADLSADDAGGGRS